MKEPDRMKRFLAVAELALFATPAVAGSQLLTITIQS
jgi:hypothetical protein